MYRNKKDKDVTEKNVVQGTQTNESFKLLSKHSLSLKLQLAIAPQFSRKKTSWWGMFSKKKKLEVHGVYWITCIQILIDYHKAHQKVDDKLFPLATVMLVLGQQGLLFNMVFFNSRFNNIFYHFPGTDVRLFGL